MAKKEDIALRLDQARRDLEQGVVNAVRRHAPEGEPISIDINLVEKPDSGAREAEEKYGGLVGEITALVDSFMNRPEVRESGASIYKVQAMDADGDGTVAVNVQYEYAVNPGMQGSERSSVGGTG
ncbi:MAG: hypothetical protein ACOCTG_05815 [Bacteroidota bacterium]